MYVEAFTNRTFLRARGASFAPGDAAYAPGDELELCYAAGRPDLDGLSPEDAAQAVFGTLNPADHEKPRSLAFPSLSVGDVVSCRDDTAEPAAWSLAVEAGGSPRSSRPSSPRPTSTPATGGSWAADPPPRGARDRPAAPGPGVTARSR